MNILSRDKQIQVIAALCDGLGVRAAARITGVNRGTVGALAYHAVDAIVTRYLPSPGMLA